MATPGPGGGASTTSTSAAGLNAITTAPHAVNSLATPPAEATLSSLVVRTPEGEEAFSPRFTLEQIINFGLQHPKTAPEHTIVRRKFIKSRVPTDEELQTIADAMTGYMNEMSYSAQRGGITLKNQFFEFVEPLNSRSIWGQNFMAPDDIRHYPVGSRGVEPFRLAATIKEKFPDLVKKFEEKVNLFLRERRDRVVVDISNVLWEMFSDKELFLRPNIHEQWVSTERGPRLQRTSEDVYHKIWSMLSWEYTQEKTPLYLVPEYKLLSFPDINEPAIKDLHQATAQIQAELRKLFLNGFIPTAIQVLHKEDVRFGDDDQNSTFKDIFLVGVIGYRDQRVYREDMRFEDLRYDPASKQYVVEGGSSRSRLNYDVSKLKYDVDISVVYGKQSFEPRVESLAWIENEPRKLLDARPNWDVVMHDGRMDRGDWKRAGFSTRALNGFLYKKRDPREGKSPPRDFRVWAQFGDPAAYIDRFGEELAKIATEFLHSTRPSTDDAAAEGRLAKIRQSYPNLSFVSVKIIHDFGEALGAALEGLQSAGTAVVIQKR